MSKSVWIHTHMHWYLHFICCMRVSKLIFDCVHTIVNWPVLFTWTNLLSLQGTIHNWSAYRITDNNGRVWQYKAEEGAESYGEDNQQKWISSDRFGSLFFLSSQVLNAPFHALSVSLQIFILLRITITFLFTVPDIVDDYTSHLPTHTDFVRTCINPWHSHT